MKNILKSTAVAALMFISLTSMAFEPTTSLVKGNDAKSLVFKMVSASKASIVSMSDKEGNTLFYDDVMSTDYSKLFNLKNLYPGTFYLKVNDPAKSVVYTVEIENNKVTIIDKEENFTPSVFGKEGNKVRLNLENSDLNKVDIKILNEDNAKVFGETMFSQASIAKTFNFEKTIKGNYIISVKDGKKVYYQNVSVD